VKVQWWDYERMPDAERKCDFIIAPNKFCCALTDDFKNYEADFTFERIFLSSSPFIMKAVPR
jgi:hypothetical protein